MKSFFSMLLLMTFIMDVSFAQNIGGKSAAEVELEKQRNADKNNIRVLYRSCNKDGASSITVNPIQLTSQDAQVTCDNVDDFLDGFDISFKAAEKCVEAYDKYKEKAEEGKKTAEDDLKELQEERADKINSSQEEIVNNQKASEDADLAYQEAMDAYQAALAELEKNTNDLAQSKAEELQKVLSELERELTITRDGLNAQLTQKYDACKNDAMKMYYQLRGALKQGIAAQNAGKISSGGASFSKNPLKQIQNDAKEEHKKCIDRENKNYQIAYKDSQSREKQLNTKVQSMQSELNRLTNDEYQKQIGVLQKTVQRAGVANNSSKNKLLQDNQRLMQKQAEDTRIIDEQIALTKARISVGDNTSAASSKKAQSSALPYFGKCCTGGKLRSDVSGFPGVPDSAQCKTTTTPKKSGTRR